jgi:hypothetical protein
MAAVDAAAQLGRSEACCTTTEPGFAWVRHNYALAVTVVVTATLVARSCGLLVSSIDADEGVYLVMAQQWLRGGLPYVAVWDHHPPGLAALLAVIQTITFDPVLGARLAAAGAVAMTAILIHRFCVRYADQPGAGLTGALLYIVCISRWAGLSANTEVFNNLCVALAAYLLVGAARRPPDLPRAITAAAAFGFGLQIKYVIFPEAAVLSLGYLVALHRQCSNFRLTAVAAGSMIVAGCLPTGLAATYFWLQGALRPFLDANIGSNITYIGIIPPLSDIVRDTASAMWPIAGPVLIIGYAVLRKFPWRRQWHAVLSTEAWILLWIVAAALDVCLPMKFFRHHFFALYAPVCLGGALALAEIAAGRRKTLAYGILMLLVTAIPAWAMGVVRASPWKATDAPREIAAFVRQAGAGDGDVYVYRYHSIVYALARIRPPTPYVMTLELAEFSKSAHVDGVAEIRRIMDNRPQFVIQARALHDAPATGAVDDLMTRSLDDYRLVREFVDDANRSVVGLYER